MAGFFTKARGAAPLALAFFALTFAAYLPGSVFAAADPRTVGVGNVSESNMRTMFKNSNGYWLFFNNAGIPSWTYSPSGDAGSWRAGPLGEPFSKAIFDGTGYVNLGTNPTVWYVETSSLVFVAVGDINSVTSTDRPVHLRKGQVNDDGSITWIHSGEINLSPCTAAGNQPWNDATVSIAVDNDGYVWINEMGSDGGLPGQADNMTPYAKANTPWSVGNSSWNAVGANQKLDNYGCTSDGNDNESGNLNVVVPHSSGDANNKVWMFGHGGATEGTMYFYNENDNTANTAELATAINFYPGNNNLNYEANSDLSATVDSAGNLHFVWIDVSRDVRYARYNSANAMQSVHTAAVGTYTHASISVAKGAVDKVFVGYVSDLGDVYVSSAPTNAAATADWKLAYSDIGAEATKISLPYSVYQPYPLPFTYYAGGSVVFDWAITSDYPPPSLASVAITSSPATAPYTTDSYDIVLKNSSGFLKLSEAEKVRGKVMVLGNEQNDIVVGTSTYHSTSSMTISVRVAPPITGGPYDLKIVNPDGQFTLASNYLYIPAPSLNILSDPDPADGKISGAGFPNNTATDLNYRTLQVNGAGFMKWSSANMSTLEFLSGGSAVSGVTVSTVTNIAAGQGAGSFSANLKISTSASVSYTPYDVRIVNPSGQYSLQKDATFYVTIATVAVSYPSLNGDTTGFTQVKGGMWLNPQFG
ncbi:MAG TPA: hypothetical protein DCZ93_07175, partial [Elusimicrobia bacterium]|nr:hypothetical protein [Elusimicrobiota bacterium]